MKPKQNFSSLAGWRCVQLSVACQWAKMCEGKKRGLRRLKPALHLTS